uniref:Rho-GAP domain-containing protein n=1 Tax=Romanomermis culicivorax TaxID=13658 RepID=A0A915IS00_ROMCU
MLIGIRNLTFLLPTANRDTLLILLQFLRQVSQHSKDTVDQQGVLKAGNKMNTHNLATIFGPNILRPSTSNKRINEQLSNNENTVKVVQFMIENCDEIYTVPKETLNSLYKLMQETEADVVDRILSSLYTSSIK